MTTDRLGMTLLSDGECFELLRGEQVGRLAVAIGPHPDIFPVNYVVDGRSIVFRTLEGTKLAASVLTPAVAFEVDGIIEASDEAWSVVVKGRAARSPACPSCSTPWTCRCTHGKPRQSTASSASSRPRCQDGDSPPWTHRRGLRRHAPADDEGRRFDRQQDQRPWSPARPRHHAVDIDTEGPPHMDDDLDRFRERARVLPAASTPPRRRSRERRPTSGISRSIGRSTSSAHSTPPVWPA